MTAWATSRLRTKEGRDADRPTASKDDLDREYNTAPSAAAGTSRGTRPTGTSADAREARHKERSGPAPDRGQHTPAEQRWHDGYRSGGNSARDLMRDLEESDLEKEAG